MKKLGFTALVGLAFIFGAFAFSPAFADYELDNYYVGNTEAASATLDSTASAKHESVDYGFTYTIYQVRRGNKLEHIARDHSSDIYKISVEEILALNPHIKNRNRILAGSTLKLPMFYEKEVEATVPAIVQAAVAPEKAALTKAKRDMKIKTIAWMLLTIIVMVYLALARFSTNRKPNATKQIQENTDAQKFFTPNETREAFLKKSGQEIDEFLEWGAVVVPRGPGSDASTVKKFKNLQDLLRQNPDLRDIPLENWNNYLWGKINQIAPAPAEPKAEAVSSTPTEDTIPGGPKGW